ncbi:helix-turn-helix domain-containing protein [Thioclava sp. GXIMD2076]|uniref:Helix-turn-helix domain-containing protein n=1 Tax=Thioclava kandeliae TaxID=3070818 RepID=A0ABV1SE34_9RHOB
MLSVASERKGISRIDTEGLPPKDRLPFWRDVVCQHFSPAATDLPDWFNASSFHARMTRRDLGSVGLSHVEASPQNSLRDRASLRRDPSDCFFLSYVTVGKSVLKQGGREAVQGPGEFLLYDSAQPFTYAWNGDYAGYWLRLPRHLLTNRLASAEVLTARTISASAPIGRLVGQMIEESFGLDLCGETPAARRVATSLVDLVTAAFETQTGLGADYSARHQGLLDRAKSHILVNLENNDLNIDAMVKDLGVSRRTLARLFAHEDTTPTRWLWSQRLERARMMICEADGARITEIALACGFSDISHFSRAFKAEFGITAKAMMAARAS